MNTKSIAISIIAISLTFIGCTFGQQFVPALTPTAPPTSTHLPTSTPPPTSTSIPPTATPVPPDLSGKVTGKENNFANRYFVLCKILDTACEFTSLVATSNSDGYFEFQDVPAGNYYIFYDSGSENFSDAAKKWEGNTIQVGDVEWLVDNYVTHNEDGGISFSIVEDTVLDQNTAYMMVYRFFATSPFLWAHTCDSGGCSQPENVLPVIASVSNGKPAWVEFTVYGPFDELSGEAPAAASPVTTEPGCASTNDCPDSSNDIFVSDSFDDNTNEWSVGDVDGQWWVGTRLIQNGVLDWNGISRQSMFSEQSPGKADLPGNLTDMRVSSRAILLNLSMDGYYGIIIRATDNDDQFSFYYFVISGASYAFILYKDDEYKTLIDWQESPDINNGDWNKLTVEGIGRHFRLFINDNLVAETDDSTLSSGQGGIIVGVWQGGEKIQAQFDDFEVRVPEQP